MLPKDWEIRKIESITDKIGSGVTPTGGQSVYLRTGAPFIRSQNVGWGVLLLEDIYYLPAEIHNKMSSTVLKKNDVLLNITGASIGRSAIVDERIEGGNVNQHVCIIRPKSEIVNPFYLNQFLISDKGQKLIDSYQSGGNRQGLNFEQIKSFEMPIPPLSEQILIAEILGTSDLAIEKTKLLISKKQNKKKALMQNLLTGKVRFKEFKKEKWKNETLKDISKLIKDGTHGTHLEVENGIPLLSAKDIQDGKVLIPDDCRKISESDYTSIHKNYKIEIGDLILTIVGTIGRCALIRSDEGRFTFQRSVGIIKLKDNLSPEYFFQLFSSSVFTDILIKKSNASAQAGVYLGELEKITVTFPENRLEQDKIGYVLNETDNEIQKLKSQLKKLKLQKKGLMQLLLSGKIRVKTKK